MSWVWSTYSEKRRVESYGNPNRFALSAQANQWIHQYANQSMHTVFLTAVQKAASWRWTEIELTFLTNLKKMVLN